MSEALRLADALGIVSVGGPLTVTMHEAAAELRRLHALVEEDSILQRRQRDEIAQLGQALARAVERNNELEAELHEQARVNGMGGEREARVLALNSELVAALIEIEWSNNTEWQRDRARAALAKVEASNGS